MKRARLLPNAVLSLLARCRRGDPTAAQSREMVGNGNNGRVRERVVNMRSTETQSFK